MNETAIQDRVEEDACRTFDVVSDGGIAIIPLDVAYAILGRTEAAIKRIFAAKQRSYEKPSGLFACLDHSLDLHVLGERDRDIQRTLIDEFDLPFSTVAPFRRDHPMLAGVDPFVLESSTKAGTMDMLLNAGPLHAELAKLSHAETTPLFGSSANLSLTGSKFALDDIETEIRAVADIEIDHGRCKYANEEGVSSTIIDFRDFSVVRRGCCFEALSGVFRDRFDIELDDGGETARSVKIQ